MCKWDEQAEDRRQCWSQQDAANAGFAPLRNLSLLVNRNKPVSC